MPNLALDLRFLRYAVAVAEYGSFRKTAMFLDVGQSTVTRRIQSLERRLGFALFHREKSGAKLTAAGAEFLQHASSGVQQLGIAAQIGLATDKGTRGVLRLSVPTALFRKSLGQTFQRYRLAYPDVRLILSEESPVQAMHALAIGKADIAFVLGVNGFDGYERTTLWADALCLVTPANHPLATSNDVTWGDLSDHTLLFSSRSISPEAQNYVLDHISRLSSKPDVELHDVSEDGLINLVGLGCGLAVLSASAVRETSEPVRHRVIGSERQPISASAIWSARNTNPALRHLLSLIHQATE
jgi:DNA-binding transcriptional LysR family regulator